MLPGVIASPTPPGPSHPSRDLCYSSVNVVDPRTKCNTSCNAIGWLLELNSDERTHDFAYSLIEGATDR